MRQASEYGRLSRFKSIRSGQQNGSVSVAHTNSQTAVRDSKNPTKPACAVRSAASMSFVSAVR
ncbi:DUF397 domain-containing protein [Embleya sp. NPDC056575]|uniref:DUF397 domain-containing protein n=1 Tax=unclassified Embleya TaxID=2699296 RepID=UPI00369E1C92